MVFPALAGLGGKLAQTKAIGPLVQLGLAMPTGLAFGYGYGYGVRQGYSAFKPPSNTAQKLKLSTDPVQGALGAGLQSAEERTGVQTQQPLPKQMGLTTEPSIAKQVQQISPDSKRYDNPHGFSMTKEQIYKKAESVGIVDKREAFHAFAKGKYPFVSKYKKARTRSPKYYTR